MTEKEELEILCDLMCGKAQEEPLTEEEEFLADLECKECCCNCIEFNAGEDCSVGYCMRFAFVVSSNSDVYIGQYGCFVKKDK